MPVENSLWCNDIGQDSQTGFSVDANIMLGVMLQNIVNDWKLKMLHLWVHMRQGMLFVAHFYVSPAATASKRQA